jgi:hypothetical protein
MNDKSLISIAQDTYQKADEQRLYSHLRYIYGVDNIIIDRSLSKETKAEAFMLGATFSRDEIRGVECSLMVYNNTLYILSTEEQAWYESVAQAVKANTHLKLME